MDRPRVESRIRLKGVLVLGLIVASLAFPPGISGLGAAVDDPPLLHSGTAPGQTWVAYQFSTQAGSVVVGDIRTGDLGRPGQLGFALFDENNMFLEGQALAWVEGSAGAYVDAHPAPGVDVSVDETLPSLGGATGITITRNEPGEEQISGRFKLLMWLTGTVREQAEFSLRGGGGTKFLSVRTGSHAFFHSYRSFRGAATADAGFGVGARATLFGQVAETMTGTFIGSFFGNNQSVNADLSIEGPSGQMICPCSFWTYNEGDPQGEPAPPGEYFFNNTGIGAGTGFRDLVLSGVDVVLPEVADLASIGLEVAGVPAVTPVGQTVGARVSTVVENAGPFAPIDALVMLEASGTAGVRVEPDAVQALVNAIPLGMPTEVVSDISVTCTEAGSAELTFESSVAPSDGDHDPDPTNDAVSASLEIVCE